jgi:uncharacterized membrane protein YdbT with pleckstrin-like domain
MTTQTAKTFKANHQDGSDSKILVRLPQMRYNNGSRSRAEADFSQTTKLCLDVVEMSSLCLTARSLLPLLAQMGSAVPSLPKVLAIVAVVFIVILMLWIFIALLCLNRLTKKRLKKDGEDVAG